MKTETKKMSLADELRATGTELGRRAAAALEAKDEALRRVVALWDEGSLAGRVYLGHRRGEEADAHNASAIESSRTALRAGEGGA